MELKIIEKEMKNGDHIIQFQPLLSYDTLCSKILHDKLMQKRYGMSLIGWIHCYRKWVAFIIFEFDDERHLCKFIKHVEYIYNELKRNDIWVKAKEETITSNCRVFNKIIKGERYILFSQKQYYALKEKITINEEKLSRLYEERNNEKYKYLTLNYPDIIAGDYNSCRDYCDSSEDGYDGDDDIKEDRHLPMYISRFLGQNRGTAKLK